MKLLEKILATPPPLLSGPQSTGNYNLDSNKIAEAVEESQHSVKNKKNLRPC